MQITTPETYTLTVNSGSGDGNYPAGASVTISADTAPSGKEFDLWVVTSGNPVIANTASEATTLTMPASAVTVTASYKDLPPETYTLTVNNGSGDGSYTQGQVVSITADTPPSGQVFDQWVTDSGSPVIANTASETTTLTMPASDAEVTATYTTVNNTLIAEHGMVTGVSSSSWTSVSLKNSYTSMIVVATPNYTNTSGPGVVRIRNASGSGFEIKMTSSSSGSLSNVTVHYLVVEEGVYTSPKMEAKKIVSDGVNRKGSWASGEMEAYTYVNTYFNPVVLGQVMTHNDAGYSSFWASNGSQTNPPSATTCYVGKHIGEDTDTTRNSETLGVIVIESGYGRIDGKTYKAGLGSDSIKGMDDSPAYTYTFNGVTDAGIAVLSSSGMDGGDGAWPVLYGNTPVTSDSINLAMDEDTYSDSERKHTTEQIAYIVLESSIILPETFTLNVNNGSGDGSYTSGYKVSIKADTPPSGQTFDRWVITSGNPVIANTASAATTLTMPAENVTVKATYTDDTPAEEVNLILPSNGGLLETYTSEWGDGCHADDLTDSITTDDGWCSVEDPDTQQEFVYSFDSDQFATLKEAVVYAGATQGKYFSKNIEIWVSQDGTHYTKTASGTLAQNSDSVLTLSLGNMIAKRVKLVITSGYRSDYWELGEFEVFGELGGVPPDETYTLTVNNGSGDGIYKVGQMVTITADPPPSEKVFDRWVVTSGNVVIKDTRSTTTALTMPTGNVTVEASYTDGNQTDAINLLLPSNGGILKSYTSEWGRGWHAVDLTDGNTKDDGWCSVENPKNQQEFVYSFEGGQSATLNKAIVYAGAAQGKYFSKDIEIWVSIDGTNYTKAASGTLAQNSNSFLTLPLAGINAKRVKLVVTSGYRNDYWELGEFEVFGAF